MKDRRSLQSHAHPIHLRHETICSRQKRANPLGGKAVVLRPKGHPQCERLAQWAQPSLWKPAPFDPHGSRPDRANRQDIATAQGATVKAAEGCRQAGGTTSQHQWDVYPAADSQIGAQSPPRSPELKELTAPDLCGHTTLDRPAVYERLHIRSDDRND